MNHLPDPDDAFESLLTDALTSRARSVRPGGGSIGDVRTRTRRRARRRAASGVGALAVLGAVGAVVATTRGDDPQPYRLLSGDDAGGDASSGADGSTIWHCTGMLAAPGTSTTVGDMPASTTVVPLPPMTTAPLDGPDTTITVTMPEATTDSTVVVDDHTTLVEAPSTTIDLGASTFTSTTLVNFPVGTTVLPGTDGGYLMTGCSPVLPSPAPQVDQTTLVPETTFDAPPTSLLTTTTSVEPTSVESTSVGPTVVATSVADGPSTTTTG